MNTDIRFVLLEEHPMVKGLPQGVLLYGVLCGPVIGGEFNGSQMIKVVEFPDWAPQKYKWSPEYEGRLVPSALVTHAFEYPIHHPDHSNVRPQATRPFLLYEYDASEEVLSDASLIATADDYATILEHAFAHARYIQKRRKYEIVSHETMKPISHCLFDPEDANGSWVWEAAK
jgi:hypothetical protein